VIENHEEFTGPELAEVIAEVNSPFLGAVYDYSNSQTLLEDLVFCLEALMSHIAPCTSKIISRSSLSASSAFGRRTFSVKALSSPHFLLDEHAAPEP
jgi:hypothetical protein